MRRKWQTKPAAPSEKAGNPNHKSGYEEANFLFFPSRLSRTGSLTLSHTHSLHLPMLHFFFFSPTWPELYVSPGGESGPSKRKKKEGIVEVVETAGCMEDERRWGWGCCGDGGFLYSLRLRGKYVCLHG